MHDFDPAILREALGATGDLLLRRGHREVIRLVLTGGAAGILAGLLDSNRRTTDCDVIWGGDEADWGEVVLAAGEVAVRLQLPATWLNRDATIFAWCLPLGWQSRCERVGEFGPLHVVRIARIDLIGSKVVSSPRRPQDFRDLLSIRPSEAELAAAAEHLDRLEAEDLDRTSYDEQRAILARLRGGR